MGAACDVLYASEMGDAESLFLSTIGSNHYRKKFAKLASPVTTWIQVCYYDQVILLYAIGSASSQPSMSSTRTYLMYCLWNVKAMCVTPSSSTKMLG